MVRMCAGVCSIPNRRWKFFLAAVELLTPLGKKKSDDGSTFLSAIAIGERTFDTSGQKKIGRRLNFSIGERKNLYSRKNF